MSLKDLDPFTLLATAFVVSAAGTAVAGVVTAYGRSKAPHGKTEADVKAEARNTQNAIEMLEILAGSKSAEDKTRVLDICTVLRRTLRAIEEDNGNHDDRIVQLRELSAQVMGVAQIFA